jgi:hypothetical protein
METLLDLLFARYERPEALMFLQDLEARERAKSDLVDELVPAGMPQGMLTTPEGDNLFVAVLALRLKFPEDEARDKVALNIAMREQGRRSS